MTFKYILITITVLLLSARSYGQDLIIEKEFDQDVIYRGAINKFKIAIQDAVSFEVLNSDVYFNEKTSTYEIYPELGRIYELKVKATFKNDSVKLFSKKFKIQNVIAPTLFLGNYTSENEILIDASKFKDTKLNLASVGRELGYKVVIESFAIKIGVGPVITIKGDKIKNAVFDKITNLKKGSEIIIFDIKYIALNINLDGIKNNRLLFKIM